MIDSKKNLTPPCRANVRECVMLITTLLQEISNRSFRLISSKSQVDTESLEGKEKPFHCLSSCVK